MRYQGGKTKIAKQIAQMITVSLAERERESIRKSFLRNLFY